MATQSERRLNTTKALTDAALKLFAERGFEHTSMQQLVEEAGVTKGAFYHHFKSKDEVLRLLHDQFIEQMLGEAREIADDDRPAPEILRALIVALVESVDAFEANISVFFRERRALASDAFGDIRIKRDAYADVMTSVLRRGQKAGQLLADIEPKVVAFGIIGMCSWVHEWYRKEGEMSATQVGHTYADMVLEGLIPRSAAH